MCSTWLWLIHIGRWKNQVKRVRHGEVWPYDSKTQKQRNWVDYFSSLFFFFLYALLKTKCQSSDLWQFCHLRQNMCSKFPGNLKWRMTFKIIFSAALESKQTMGRVYERTRMVKSSKHINRPYLISLIHQADCLVNKANSPLFSITNIETRLIKLNR